MATQIGTAGASIDIRLGQTPQTSDPKLNQELQGVYNALHTLNVYLDNIRNELEGTDSGTPAENLKFRRRFPAEAAQAISVGDIVCLDNTGKVVKGVHRIGARYTGHPVITGPYTRAAFLCKHDYAYVATTAAAIGGIVEVGVGGAINLPGAKCGQIVWGADFRKIRCRTGLTNGTWPNSGITGQPFSGNGAMYLSNPRWNESVGAVSATHEGLVSPGYPQVSGDYLNKERTYLYPIGICLLDDYVYIYDYVQE